MDSHMFPGGFYIVTTKLLRECGLYDEEYKNGVEDIDLFWRWKRAGKRLIMTPRIDYWHKEGATRYSDIMDQKGIQRVDIKASENHFKEKWGFDGIKFLYTRILIDERINP